MAIEFGARVRITACLHRRKEGNERTWVRIALPKPSDALFLGARLLMNGTSEYEESFAYDGEPLGGGVYFHPTEKLKGAWVCRRGHNPEKVLLADVEVV